MRDVRIWFEKRGETRYISHLDLNRFMLRALRRTRLPIWYTEGYNPHPYLSFALPLSLGFESVCESVDLRILDESCTNEQVLERFSAVMPRGIRVTAVTDPVMKQKEIAMADYLVSFPLREEDTDTVWNFVSGEHIPARKSTKKGEEKQINLKEHLHGVRLEREGENALLSLRLDAGCVVNINPMLLLDAIREQTGIDCSGASVLRKQMLNAEGKEFR